MIYVTCHICLEVGNDRPAEEGSYLCTICRVRTRLILGEIQDLYAWISDADYLAGTREPPSHYTKSRPPVSLHAVSLLDPRTKYRRRGDPVSAERVLGSWARAVVQSAEDGEWATMSWGRVTNEVWYLQQRLDWIAGTPVVVRFARHMACVLHSLRQEVGADVREQDD